GRQRSLAVVADLQCAGRLQIRQRSAAAARRAQSLQREDQPDRILLSVAIAGRADRRRGGPACASGGTVGGAADASGAILTSELSNYQTLMVRRRAAPSRTTRPHCCHSSFETALR